MTARCWLIAVVSVLLSLCPMQASGVAMAAHPTSLACEDLPASVVGTRGNDRLVGTVGDDVIVARGGADRIEGHGGDDLVCAGRGEDIVLGGPGADRVFGQDGSDRLRGRNGSDDLEGGTGSDTIRGGQGRDSVFGGGGNDDIVDLRGHSFVNAEGRSTVVTGPVRDVILATGTEARLSVRSRGGNDKVRMFWGHVNSGRGDDTVVFRGYHRDGRLRAELGAGDDRLSFDIPRRRIPSGAGIDADGGAGIDAVAARFVADDLFALTLGPRGSMTGPALGPMVRFENVNAGGAFVHTDITGSAGPNRIITGSSNDTVDGRGGDDDINVGSFGDDSIDGGNGFDRCVGATAVIVNCEILV